MRWFLTASDLCGTSDVLHAVSLYLNLKIYSEQSTVINEFIIFFYVSYVQKHVFAFMMSLESV